MKIYIMKQQVRQAKRVNYLDEHLNCLFYNGNPEIGFRHLTLQKGKTWCELSAKNNYFFFLLEGASMSGSKVLLVFIFIEGGEMSGKVIVS